MLTETHAEAHPRVWMYLEICLLQAQLMHEYDTGNWGNAQQDQHQSAPDINTDKGHQALAQQAHMHKESVPGPLLYDWQSSPTAEQSDVISYLPLTKKFQLFHHGPMF